VSEVCAGFLKHAALYSPNYKGVYMSDINLLLPSPNLVLGRPDILGELPPFSNTGGNFSRRAKKTEMTANAVCCIDYLTVSYPVDAFNVPFPLLSGVNSLTATKLASTGEWLQNIAMHLRTWTQLDNIFVVDKGRGFLGFTNSANIVIRNNAEENETIGVFAWGGASQNGRVMLSLSGAGTALIEEWHVVSEWIETTGGKITRVDLAVDFMDGYYSIDDAIADYREGNFKAAAGGSSPKAKLIHDMGSNEGKTFYIGKRENGKMLRIYEKGKQLGDMLSKWVRAEGELHNKDRIIPVDILLNPQAYWSGLNPAFAALLPFASKQVKTAKKVIEATLSSLSHYASVGYGKLLNSLMQLTDGDAQSVVSFLIQDGTPRRLRSPLVSHGFLEQLEVSVHGRALKIAPQ
jgi:phage replication initiation protein